MTSSNSDTVHTDTIHANTINVLYFASLAEKLGCRSESIELPPQVQTILELKKNIASRGNIWSTILDDNIRCSVNQTLSNADCTIQAGDEVAFFPPVTGG